MDLLAEALLQREDGDVKALIRKALGGHGLRRAELSLNVTNVVLDFEADTATVDDELDPAVSVTVTLEELRRYSR